MIRFYPLKDNLPLYQRAKIDIFTKSDSENPYISKGTICEVEYYYIDGDIQLKDYHYKHDKNNFEPYQEEKTMNKTPIQKAIAEFESKRKRLKELDDDSLLLKNEFAHKSNQINTCQLILEKLLSYEEEYIKEQKSDSFI